MANSANTAWKLTDIWNNAVFTFDGDYIPENENHAPELTGEDWNIPWDNIVQRMDYGLGARHITLQGVDVDDKDAWALSSTIAKRQLMKLWAGEDWFYYVLGVEARQVRAGSLPSKKSYNVSFKGVDPHYYWSNSTAGSGTQKNLVVPQANILTEDDWTDITLTAIGANEGSTDIEPCFWIIGGASSNITQVSILDLERRRIQYSPTSPITSGDEHVIMPYRNNSVNGFTVNEATGFQVSSDGDAATTPPSGTAGNEVGGTWAMDAFQEGYGTHEGGAGFRAYTYNTEEKGCILTLNGTVHPPRNRLYPTLADKIGSSTLSSLFMSYTGTTGAAKVYAQFCRRRV